jgi:hypothetical protein
VVRARVCVCVCVYILVVAQPSSEVPEGLMNYPVYVNSLPFCDNEYSKKKSPNFVLQHKIFSKCCSLSTFVYNTESVGDVTNLSANKRGLIGSNTLLEK